MSGYSYLVLLIVYLVVGFCLFSYSAGKHGLDGLDGIIPILMFLFWPIIVPVVMIYKIFTVPFNFLYSLGKARKERYEQ